VEWVDDLPLSDPLVQDGVERVDFLLENRRYLCELKSLQRDAARKIDPILEPLKARPDWPQFFGAWSIQNVLRQFQDGPSILRELERRVLSVVDNDVRKANRQIASTKDAIGSENAEGLLIVANDGVDILSPIAVATRIEAVLRQRREDGRPRHRHVQSAVVLTISHLVPLTGPDPRGDPGALPICILENSLVPPSAACREAVTALLAAWGKATGKPVLAVPKGARVPPVFSVADFMAAQGPQKQSDVWVHQYKGNRALSPLSDEELFSYGRSAYLRNLSVSEDGRIGASADVDGMKEFTWFLEEIRIRAIPLQVWGPKVSGRSAHPAGEQPE